MPTFFGTKLEESYFKLIEISKLTAKGNHDDPTTHDSDQPSTNILENIQLSQVERIKRMEIVDLAEESYPTRRIAQPTRTIQSVKHHPFGRKIDLLLDYGWATQRTLCSLILL